MKDYLEVDTLQKAIKFVEDNKDKGVHCPCCSQYCRVYKRKLSSSQAIALIEFYKATKNKKEYTHIMDVVQKSVLFATKMNGGDFAKLVNWGLIQEMPKDYASIHKKTSGFWRLTEKGNLFVEGKLKVPTHAIFYKNEILGFSESESYIEKCLTNHFSYTELMSS